MQVFLGVDREFNRSHLDKEWERLVLPPSVLGQDSMPLPIGPGRKTRAHKSYDRGPWIVEVPSAQAVVALVGDFSSCPFGDGAKDFFGTSKQAK